MLTERSARRLAIWVRDGLTPTMRQNLKAIHIAPRLHNGHLTIRVFMVPQIAEDPEPFIFGAENL